MGEQLTANAVFGEFSPIHSPVLSLNRQEDREDENTEVIESFPNHHVKHKTPSIS